MSMIGNSANIRAESYRSNREAMLTLVADLRSRVALISQGGGAQACGRHLSRGKLLPRERIRVLLDAGSPFLELSQFAAHGM